MSQTLIPFIVAYGYPAIFLGGIFEGESMILIGGLAAYEGYLSLPLIYLYAVLEKQTNAMWRLFVERSGKCARWCLQ